MPQGSLRPAQTISAGAIRAHIGADPQQDHDVSRPQTASGNAAALPITGKS